jgi:lauroyl/myristoyl acyltransferase
MTLATRSAAVLAHAPSQKLRTTRIAYESAGLSRTGRESDLLVQRSLAFTAGYYARTVLLRQRRHRVRLQETVLVRGATTVAETLARGQGVILTSVHLGDFDLAASWIAGNLGTPVVPIARCPSPAWQAFYDDVRASCGFELRHGPTRAAELKHDLELGHLVILMLDRRPERGGIETSWFGHRATVSAAAATLSLRTGAPLVPAATWGDGRGQRTLYFGQPRVCNSPGDAAPLTDSLVTDLEAAIRCAPEQWHIPANRHQLPWEVEERPLVDGDGTTGRIKASTRKTLPHPLASGPPALARIRSAAARSGSRSSDRPLPPP